jgi:NAD(P)-dependent dehydrogenase (short-subunit alcohol dehydrogenase family)
MQGRLEGKVAFITGVAKMNSIGFATAGVFGAEGTSLAVVDISDKVHDCAEALRAKGHRSSHTADLTKRGEVEGVPSPRLWPTTGASTCW